MNEHILAECEEMLLEIMANHGRTIEHRPNMHDVGYHINVRYYPSMKTMQDAKWADTGIGHQDVEWILCSENPRKDEYSDHCWAIFKFDIGYGIVSRTSWADYTFSSTNYELDVCHTLVFSEFADACLTEEIRRDTAVASMLLEELMR